MNPRQLFLRHVAQTSPAPIGIEMSSAKGIYLYNTEGKAFIDMISGFSVANIGHGHPAVIAAIEHQIHQYMHVIVYGEYIQQPQVAYAQLLTQMLPATLDCVYFTNSGTEATEGALKLAKRVTGRTQIIACHRAYHGSTHGALSVMGGEYFKNAFRPLLPNVYHYHFNSNELIDAISTQTACVIVETVQAESGIVTPQGDWLIRLRQKCTKTGTLLILDEIQAGFGRTGTLWAFEQYHIVPDILLLGKALGGGLPLGAFVANKTLMDAFTNNPVLGHITTFGGHPVSCAAGMAALQALLAEGHLAQIASKQQRMLEQLQHSAIVTTRSIGLWAALEFDSFATNQAIVKQCVANGAVTDWFLFNDTSLRIAPPLTISHDEIDTMCQIVVNSIQQVMDAQP